MNLVFSWFSIEESDKKYALKIYISSGPELGFCLTFVL